MIILLDGAPSLGYHTVLPLMARRFNRAGFNAALLVAPYQLRRRPRRPIEEIGLQFALLVAQYVAEIRALTGWLLNEGCPSVSLLGCSFGGWAAGLTACSDARIACAVLIVPRVGMRCSQPVILAAGSGNAPGSKPGTRSNGHDPVESDFVRASHPERKHIVD